MSSELNDRHTLEGSNPGSFAAMEWALIVTVSAIWGSSFLWVDIALESFEPQAIAFMRLVLGSAAIWLLPSARKKVERSDWRGILIVASVGNAIPLFLLPLAQQRVESSLAGMLLATTPLATLIVASSIIRKSPGRRRIFGLLVGFVGVAMMAGPNLSGANAQPLGVLLLVIGVFGFAISNIALVPLQQKYGSAPIIARALGVSVVALLPFGGPSTLNSEPSRASIGAVLILGLVATGIARTLNTTVLGRTGASRGAIVGYLIPIMAIILGVVFLGESVRLLELLGTGVVLFGAFLVSQAKK